MAEDLELGHGSSTHGGFTIGLKELDEVVERKASGQRDGVRVLSDLLKTDLKNGISQCEEEILQRRKIFGSNTYPLQKEIGFWGFVWKASQSLPSRLMLLAALITSLLRINRKAFHDRLYVEACIILAVVLDIIVRAITECTQSRWFRKLSEEQRNVRLEVIRGGRRVKVLTNDIVVGEIVPLKYGDEVPADGILCYANSLKIDESGRTGSHVTEVPKDLIRDPLKDPFLYSGSKVNEGIGKMLVIRVGRRGGIRHETGEEKPFQGYLKWLANSASWIIVLFASVACIVQLGRYFSGRTKRTDGTPMFILGTTTASEATEFVIKSLSFGIATIVVGLPVGFSTAVLLNLAKTTRKMKSDNALVQRLSAYETMGYVTTILCKAEILTSNQMSVVDVRVGKRQGMDNLSELPAELKELIIEGIAHNTDGSVVSETGVTEVYGTQMEQAILNFGNELGMKFDDARSLSVVRYTIPFDPNKKYGGVGLQVDTHAHVHWKGSAKVILNFCVSYMDEANNLGAIDEQQREIFERTIENMCMQGMHCAALAYRPYDMDCLPTNDDLILLAIIGIKDPCRPDTSNAIQLCKPGGVKVCMVIDDVVSTATAIATECGIPLDAPGAITTGADFRALSDRDKEETVGKISVYAQASPSDIRLLVEKQQKSGERVAVIGMGIPDIETLRLADVSLAMGTRGTAAAKENSDIIILEESFATAVKVILWVRSLYTNIQRYVQFRLTVNVSAAAICVLVVVLYEAFPFNPVQLLLVNLIIDIFGALALTYRPISNHLTPPIRKSDPLVTKRMWAQLVTQVIYLVMFRAVIHPDSILNLKHGNTGNAEQVENTFKFCSAVFCLVFSEFEIRSATFKEVVADNMFLATITATIIFQIIILQIFGVRLDWKIWLLSVLAELFQEMAIRFPFQAFPFYRN